MQKENRIKDSEKAMLMRSLIAATQLTNEEIADKIKDEINSLYRKYILTDTEAKAIVKDAPVRNKKHYGEE